MPSLCRLPSGQEKGNFQTYPWVVHELRFWQQWSALSTPLQGFICIHLFDTHLTRSSRAFSPLAHYQSSLPQQQGAVYNQLLSAGYERPTLIFNIVTNNFVVLLTHTNCTADGQVPGRISHYWPIPPQIRTWAIHSYGSSVIKTSFVLTHNFTTLQAIRHCARFWGWVGGTLLAVAWTDPTVWHFCDFFGWANTANLGWQNVVPLPLIACYTVLRNIGSVLLILRIAFVVAIWAVYVDCSDTIPAWRLCFSAFSFSLSYAL